MKPLLSSCKLLVIMGLMGLARAQDVTLSCYNDTDTKIIFQVTGLRTINGNLTHGALEGEPGAGYGIHTIEPYQVKSIVLPQGWEYTSINVGSSRGGFVAHIRDTDLLNQAIDKQLVMTDLLTDKDDNTAASFKIYLNGNVCNRSASSGQ